LLVAIVFIDGLIGGNGFGDFDLLEDFLIGCDMCLGFEFGWMADDCPSSDDLVDL
jgi:hypothetical protein